MTLSDEWIEWKWSPEKPYPAATNKLVYVKCGNEFDDSESKHPLSVQWWSERFDMWRYAITHYKLATPRRRG